MKTTGVILLALVLGSASCKSEKSGNAANVAQQAKATETVTQQPEATETEILAETEVLDEAELPVYGNFQLASK